MSTNCSIVPQVRGKDGNIKDSKLFKDLLSFSSNDRALAVRIYQTTKNPDFIRDFETKLKFDENGEPTLKSLLDKAGLNKFIDNQQVLNTLNEQIGHTDRKTKEEKLLPDTVPNREELAQKAIQFNESSDFRDAYVALPYKKISSQDRPSIGIEVKKKTPANEVTSRKMKYNQVLNDKLRSILSSWGIDVGVLTEVEERAGVNGVTDFDVAEYTANGLIQLIRIAKGAKGEEVLPEEFSHTAIAIMKDSPLVQRLLNNIKSNGLAASILGDQFDSYNQAYQEDEDKVAEEAAGKLLAEALKGEYNFGNLKSLLQRVITSIKNFFSQFSISQLEKAKLDAETSAAELAKDILQDNKINKVDLVDISKTGQFYNLNERTDRAAKTLKRLIDTEVKRLAIYEKRSTNSTFSTAQRLHIDQLELALQRHNEAAGIVAFVQKAVSTLKDVNERLLSLENEGVSDITKMARVLRDMRNYYYSYDSIVEELLGLVNDEKKFEDDIFDDSLRDSLVELSGILRHVKSNYTKVALPLFVEFLKPFTGEEIAIPLGKYKGHILTAEEIVQVAKQDISFMDRWLDSMANSSSQLLRVIDHAVKQSKEAARIKTIGYRKRLEEAIGRLEAAGVKDTEWMFETDSQGNKTGRYISEIDWGKYRDAKRAFEDYLRTKYGNNPVGEDSVKYLEEKMNWYKSNTSGGKPSLEKYRNKEFATLSPAKKAYYNTIMEIKEELDSFLPENYTKLLRTVKIRKDLIERVKQSDGVKSGSQQLWEAIKDNFIRRTDDTDLGEKAALKDFEGREVQMLPIYFTKLKEGESENDVSTDVTSTMIAYAAMACDFSEMNKIIDVLEVGREYLRNNLDVKQTVGGNQLVESFKAGGRKIESAIFKRKGTSRIIERLDDYFNMQVYGRYMRDEGTIGNTKLDTAKAANFLNRLTAINMLGINLNAGISNVATGKVMMRIESFARQFFTERNTLHADNAYRKALPQFLAEVGNRTKTSKLALWDEYFNVMQDYEQEYRNAGYDRKTWFSRMFGESSLFFLNNGGEHWMQNRTSLALADAYKMKAPGPHGKIVSLWDAMEVVYKDPNNHKLGAELKVKKGYTKEDGTAFTEKDAIAFSRKSAAINQRMHGIYNKLDKDAFQSLAIGRMCEMFRKWMRPAFVRRFGTQKFNYDLQDMEEGYYRTTWHFLNQIVKELREGQFSWTACWGTLTKEDKQNIARALTEVGHLVLVSVALGLIDWPEKDERTWLTSVVEYQLRRLNLELGAMVPGTNIREFWQIVQSPTADVKTAQGLIDLIGLLNPWNYEAIGGEDALIESGRYKGHSRAFKIFFESAAVPMNKTIYKGLHPEESIPFYKQ